MVETVKKTLLSDVLRPLVQWKLPHFVANVLANVVSAAFSVIVALVYSGDWDQLPRHMQVQSVGNLLCAATVLTHAKVVLDTRRPSPNLVPGRKSLAGLTHLLPIDGNSLVT